MHENRETSRASARADRSGKVKEPINPGMYVLEESDCAIVPDEADRTKKAKASAEPAEGRVQTRENDAHLNTDPTQSGATVSQGLGGVRQAARARKQERLTALLQPLTIDLLREGYFALKRRAAAAVDGVSLATV